MTLLAPARPPRSPDQSHQHLPLPVGVLSRVPLPDELVDAITAALDREAVEMDARVRSRLLAGTRAALEGWLAGSATTAQTVGALTRLAHPWLAE